MLKKRETVVSLFYFDPFVSSFAEPELLEFVAAPDDVSPELLPSPPPGAIVVESILTESG